MAENKPTKQKKSPDLEAVELRIGQVWIADKKLFFEGSVGGGEVATFRMSCDEYRDLAGAITAVADYQDEADAKPAKKVTKLPTVEFTPSRSAKVRHLPISDLTAIIPPPAKPGEVGSTKLWDSLERQIGPVPQDYKDYITTYGTGSLGGFVRVYNPFAADENAELMTAIVQFSAINTHLQQSEGDRFPYPVFPEPSGIIPWASDDNGNIYYWKTGDDNPDNWAVVVQASRSPYWQEVRSTLTAFLVDAFSQRIKCRFWPSDFPDPNRPDTFQFKPFKRKRK